MLRPKPSPYCAWCGKAVEVGVIVAGVVVYHQPCWERRACPLGARDCPVSGKTLGLPETLRSLSPLMKR